MATPPSSVPFVPNPSAKSEALPIMACSEMRQQPGICFVVSLQMQSPVTLSDLVPPGSPSLTFFTCEIGLTEREVKFPWN